MCLASLRDQWNGTAQTGNKYTLLNYHFFLSEFFSSLTLPTPLPTYTIFLKEQFYKNKSLGFGKKFKNKLRTKPGLLSHRT